MVRIRRGLRAPTASLAIMLVVSACTGGGTTTSVAGPSTTAEADASGSTTTTTPVASAELVVGRTGDIDIVDPHLATAFQSVRTLELVYESLTALDQDLNVVPALAESWTFSDDGLTLTLDLRDGVVFHDGSVFDAEDVTASIDRILDEATGAVARSNLASITGVSAPDPGTVVLELAAPDASILASLADLNTAMVSSAAIADGSIGTQPNGTGAFRWESWEQGSAINLAGNPDFWGGAPAIETLILRVIPDEASILSGLRAGEIDLAVMSDPVIVGQITEPELTVLRTPALSYHVLQLNGDRPPLDDARVRQAISCAVDRQEVVDLAALGEGEVTGPLTIPAYRSDTDGLPCDGVRDVEEAKRLLGEAGLADGFSLNTIVITGEYATAGAEAEVLQAQLAEAGITLELEVLETATYVDRWLAADFDAAVALNGGRVDPHQMYARYWTSTGNLNTVAGYRSDRLDELMAAGQAETDPEARKAIYDQFSEELQSQAPWIWLFTGFEYQVHGAGVSGFVPMSNGSLRYLSQTSITG